LLRIPALLALLLPLAAQADDTVTLPATTVAMLDREPLRIGSEDDSLAQQGSALDAAAGDVVASALSLIGTPYVYGGDAPEGGFDCSGLVSYVYNQAGYTSTLPRSSQELYQLHLPAVRRSELQAGDLLFFHIGHSGKGRHAARVNHVAIYVGNNRFVHAPNSRSSVRVDDLDEAYWQRYFVGARRVLSSVR
jgi:cell wall-associated NlpC family hydrolase